MGFLRCFSLFIVMEEREFRYLLAAAFLAAYAATLIGGASIAKTAIEQGIPSDVLLAPFRVFAGGAMLMAGVFLYLVFSHVPFQVKESVKRLKQLSFQERVALAGDALFLAVSLAIAALGLWILAGL